MKIKKIKKRLLYLHDKEESFIHMKDLKQTLSHVLVSKKCKELSIGLIKKHGYNHTPIWR